MNQNEQDVLSQIAFFQGHRDKVPNQEFKDRLPHRLPELISSQAERVKKGLKGL